MLGKVFTLWRRTFSLGLLRPSKFLPSFVFPKKIPEITSVTPIEKEKEKEELKKKQDNTCPPNSYNPLFTLHHLEKASKNGNVKQLKKWNSFYEAQSLGRLSVGTRQAVIGTPTWVTLQVATGGFATGEYMAGGDLQPHELEYFHQFFGEEETPSSPEECRENLNRQFLTEGGFTYLSHLLETSKFEIRVPEEGALLTVVWLFENGNEESAKELLKTIEPWFGKLRFYPIPSQTPLSMGVDVSVASVNEVMRQLITIETPALLQQNRKIVEEAIPLYDEFIAAILRTTKGEHLPEIINDRCEGDLPFEVADAKRKDSVSQALAKIYALPQNIRSTRRFTRGNFVILERIAKEFVSGYHPPNNARIARKILAEINKKRGLPGSAKLAELRGKQKEYVATIGLPQMMGTILYYRLKPEREKPGITDIDSILQPVQKKEAEGRSLLHEGQPILANLAEKVKRAKLVPVEQLCAEGLVPSAEVLAILCPTLVSNVISSGLTDKPMAALYGAIYQAFKNRRSLLLMNLETQVKITELPWFAELEKMKAKISAKKAEEEAVKSTLEDLVVLALKHWPQTIFPNKFVDVLKDLSKQYYNDGEYKGLPFVKELANDIFMGKFNANYLINAKIAAKMLSNSLYESYYEVDFKRIANFQNEQELEQYCGAKQSNWGQTVENGKAIEKCMITTTHNLALAFEHLNLGDKMQSILPQLPPKIFEFVIHETQKLASVESRYARLQMIKDAAYSLRQMVFFLSLLPQQDKAEFFAWAFYRCEKIKDEAYKQRILLPLKSLYATWKGEKEPKKTVFLAWTGSGDERHFMLPPEK